MHGACMESLYRLLTSPHDSSERRDHSCKAPSQSEKVVSIVSAVCSGSFADNADDADSFFRLLQSALLRVVSLQGANVWSKRTEGRTTPGGDHGSDAHRGRPYVDCS